jgi:SH3-like domain-containing protein
LIKDKSDNFRKIIDHENNSGWIHVSQLSKKKAALNNADNSIIFKRPSYYSKPLALVEKGRLYFIKKCEVKWCKVVSGDYTGWIVKNSLWGKTE